jgi:hypothetical protein
MAPLIVPAGSEPDVHQYSRALPQGAVLTTLVNRAYAPVSNQRNERSGPYSAGLVCSCGQANPDACVRTLQGTMPFHDNELSRQLLKSNLKAAPYAPLPISPVQAFLQLRAGPLST